jgi:hypothetical protein
MVADINCDGYGAMTYVPKGSMCMSCKYAKRDCSNLPFSTMQPMSKRGDVVTVKCTQYVQKEKQ